MLLWFLLPKVFPLHLSLGYMGTANISIQHDKQVVFKCLKSQWQRGRGRGGLLLILLLPCFKPGRRTSFLPCCDTRKRAIRWVVVWWALTFKADRAIVMAVTESMDAVSREEATKEPLAPSAQPGSESEQANTTDGSYVNLVPGVFSDIDDHHNQLQTLLSTSKAYKLKALFVTCHYSHSLKQQRGINGCRMGSLLSLLISVR